MVIRVETRAAAWFLGVAMLAGCTPPVYLDSPAGESHDMAQPPPPRVSGADGVLTGSCPGGARQTCYPGPALTENIGTCAPGLQECDNVEGSGTWGPCLGAVVPKSEMCVAGEIYDTNCDGLIDRSACCPKDSIFTATISVRPPVKYSAVVPGGQWSLLGSVSDCSAPISCKPGEQVLSTGRATRCMPAAPKCNPEEALFYDGPPAAPTGWRCIPCPIVVEFGELYDGARHCAVKPALTCPNGQVPTYDPVLLDWVCKPKCNNGEYDLHLLNGQIVCVPC